MELLGILPQPSQIAGFDYGQKLLILSPHWPEGLLIQRCDDGGWLATAGSLEIYRFDPITLISDLSQLWGKRNADLDP